MPTLKRDEIFTRILRRHISKADAARELHITPTAVGIGYKRWLKRNKFAPPPPASPAPAPSTPFKESPVTVKTDSTPVNTNPDSILQKPDANPVVVVLPANVDELLKGETSDPAPAPAPRPVENGGDGGNPPSSPAPAPVVDEEAAELGRLFILKIRAAILRTALRYFGNVNPNDPRLHDILSPADMAAIRSRESMLDLVLKKNPEKTQKLGGLFRGWPGFLFGFLAEGFNIVGTVRAVAEETAPPSPPVQPQAPAAPPARPQAPPARPQAPPPAPEKGVDIGAMLAAAEMRVSR